MWKISASHNAPATGVADRYPVADEPEPVRPPSSVAPVPVHAPIREGAPAAAAESTVCLARQPIVDDKLELVGFELLFRGADGGAPVKITDDLLATSTVVANVFTEFGLEQVVGNRTGFINVDEVFLFSELVESLPTDHIVLELVESQFCDFDALERVRELKAMGYRIAVDDFVGNFDELGMLLPAVDLVKVDFHAIDPLLVPVIVDMLAKHKVQLVASKVETREQFAQARELGIRLFQGYHFAQPEVLRARREKPARLALLRLLTLALDDSDTDGLEAELKHHPSLTVNLLRLINSAAMGRPRVITSLRHALALLGRRQLRIWLQLLLYTTDRHGPSLGSPLLQLAATRGKMLEQLALNGRGAAGEFAETAFMTGMLSLMEVLLGMPLEEILVDIKVPQGVNAALLRREGELGLLLSLVEALEHGDLSAVAPRLQQLKSPVRPADLLPMQVAAYRWANEVSDAP